MGNNICSLSFSCDHTVSRCLDFTVRKTGFISQLPDNLAALQRELKKLLEARNDIRIRVTVAEQQQMRRLEQVQGWLSRVQDAETEAGKLIQKGLQEVERLCLGGFCSKNCLSTYKYGKQVFKTLRVVEN